MNINMFMYGYFETKFCSYHRFTTCVPTTLIDPWACPGQPALARLERGKMFE